MESNTLLTFVIIALMGSSFVAADEKDDLEKIMKELDDVLPEVIETTLNRDKMTMDELLFNSKLKDFISKLEDGKASKEDTETVIKELMQIADEIKKVEDEEKELTKKGNDIVPQLRDAANKLKQ